MLFLFNNTCYHNVRGKFKIEKRITVSFVRRNV